MKTLAAFLVSMFAATTLANANPYYDGSEIVRQRAQIARQRDQQQAANTRTADAIERTAMLEKQIWGFIRAHRGLATEAVCSVQHLDCASDIGCFPGREQKISLNAVTGQMLWILRCDVVLNDGLACTVTQKFSWEKKASVGIEAGCYDEKSNYTNLVYPGGTAKATPKKRQAR